MLSSNTHKNVDSNFIMSICFKKQTLSLLRWQEGHTDNMYIKCFYLPIPKIGIFLKSKIRDKWLIYDLGKYVMETHAEEIMWE